MASIYCIIPCTRDFACESSRSEHDYAENKEKIADKKGLIIEKMLRRVALIEQHVAARVT